MSVHRTTGEALPCKPRRGFDSPELRAAGRARLATSVGFKREYGNVAPVLELTERRCKEGTPVISARLCDYMTLKSCDVTALGTVYIRRKMSQ